MGDLQLRSISKHQNLHPVEVRSVKTEAEVRQWVQKIGDLHRTTKAGTQVQYSKRMPDIESLMQVWPAGFEEYIEGRSFNLSALEMSDDSDFSMKDYVKMICVLMDIPVHDGSLTDSLHVLFTLYSEFKNNQHFAGNTTFGGGSAVLSPAAMSGDIFMPGRAGTPV